MAEPDIRFTLANERTFLAWVRTSIGLVAAGVALFHFLDESAGTTAMALMSVKAATMPIRTTMMVISASVRMIEVPLHST